MDNINHLFTEYDLLLYYQAINEASTYLENMLKDYRHSTGRNCFYMISNRIKTLESINKKIKKKIDAKGKNFDYRIDLLDIAGIRVVFCDWSYFISYMNKMNNYNTQFNCLNSLDNIIHNWSANEFRCEFERAKLYQANYDIVNLYDFVEFLMRKSDQVAIVKDYIMYQKDSGYQSLHVIITVPVKTDHGDVCKIPVEIQVRNYMQHLYNECEHGRYKKEKIGDDYSHAFNEAKKFLLTISNEAFKKILDTKCENRLLIRKD